MSGKSVSGDDELQLGYEPGEGTAEANRETSRVQPGGQGSIGNEELARLRDLVCRYRMVFAMNSAELGRTTVQHHNINTKGRSPIFQAPRRLPWNSREATRELVKGMKKQGVVEDSTSPWSSPIVLVKKKDGSTRFCVDYRKLNAVTERDPYPLPRIDDTLDALSGAKYFSTLDLCSGYHQLPMAEEDKEKTGFSTPDGHYQFTVMPFGVCNGPSSFQRLMSVVLRVLQWQICLVYLNDVIVFAKTFDEHLERLEAVFERLLDAGLRLKPSKCFLLRTRVDFLGHVVSEEGVSTDEAKTHRVATWEHPTNVAEIRAFLGFCGYYRRFVPNFSDVAKPLTQLTKQGHAFVWTEECEEAFATLKSRLTSSPTLAYPQYGPDAPRFILDVDASGTGLGAVLSQQDEKGVERPIAFASRLTSASERRYASTKSELLGVVWAFNHFRCYLLGKRFLVRSDHKALQHLDNFKEPAPIVARWLEFLSQFEYDLQYRKGKAHSNADGLSRQKTKPVMNVTEVAPTVPGPLVQRRDWTYGTWAIAQQADPDLRQLFEWLMDDGESADLTGISPTLRKYWRGHQHLSVKGGVIGREWVEPEISAPNRFQILIPVDLRTEILKEYHDFLGHVGMKRTIAQLRTRFYWHGMSRDVEDWIGTCTSCCRRSRPVGRGQGAPLQVSWAGYPFERVAMDLIPGLPETSGGNRHILVVVDYFTKWVEAYPLKRMDAATVASVFVSEFVSRFGAPDSLHTDQGENFDSKLFKNVCGLLGIKKTRTTAYHPSGDGLVERFNQTLERLLSHYVQRDQRDWDVQLPAALMAYRATTQASTGYTPAYLLFGREFCLPQDVAYGLPPAEQLDEPTYVRQLRSRLADVHTIVRHKLGAVHRHQAHLYDHRAVSVEFAEGSLVWLLVPAVPVGTSTKLAKLWKGPFKVLNRLSDVVYRVRDMGSDSAICQVVHVNRLKKCRVRPTHLATVVREEASNSSPTRNPIRTPSPQPSSYTPDTTDLLYAERAGGRDEQFGGVELLPIDAAVAPADVNRPVQGVPLLPANAAVAPAGVNRPVRRRRPPQRLEYG